MVPDSITTWLMQKRRTELTWGTVYLVAACAVGGVFLALTFGVAFVASKIVLLVVAPSGSHTNLLSATLAAVAIVFICLDSFQASRDDMSMLPLWFIRESVHFGPRVIMDGIREGARARRFSQIDVGSCANVLSYLAMKNVATPRIKLEQQFPTVPWTLMVDQLGLLEGVLFFHPDYSRVILTTPLRLELRALLGRQRVHLPPEEEPQPAPVVEPEKLSPCDILGVSPTASPAEIKAAYRNRIKECHPDRFAGMDERARGQAEEWTKALNSAYHTLMAQRVRRRV